MPNHLPYPLPHGYVKPSDPKCSHIKVQNLVLLQSFYVVHELTSSCGTGYPVLRNPHTSKSLGYVSI